MTGREIYRKFRSLLFSPGNHPQLSMKLPKLGADANVIDLEDGTPDRLKEATRPVVMKSVQSLRSLDWKGNLFVRVNGPHTAWMDDDILAVAGSGITGIVVPMLRSAAEVVRVTALLQRCGAPESIHLIAGIETGFGVERINEILDASPQIVAAYFGSEDFATDVGIKRTDTSTEILYARSRVALACANRGIHAFDKGVIEVRDEYAFEEDCKRGREIGYTGKICVAPRQVVIANNTFMPTADEVEKARKLISAYEEAVKAGSSAPEIDGKMIDGPLVVRARKIIEAS